MSGRLAFALVWLLLGARSASTQEVRGQVRDRDANRPVSLGIMMLVREDGSILAHTALGPQGQYVFRAPGAGRYLVQFIGPGYGPHGSIEFSLRVGEVRVFGVQVSSLRPAALDTITVASQAVPRRLATFYERRAAGAGEFVAPRELQQGNPTTLTDVLRRTTGVAIVSTPLGTRVGGRDPELCPSTTSGRAGPLFFLDGVFVGNGMALDVDWLLPLATIEAVEVYGGNNLPPDALDREGSECGVVALWTRASAVPAVPLAIEHPIDIGTQMGGWIGGGGVQEGRAGLRIVIGAASRVEVSPAFNVVRSGAIIGTGGTDRSGTQLVLAVRVRPMGVESPWYVGGGVTFLSLRNARFNVEDEDHLLALTGYNWRFGRVRPFVELHLLRPLTPSDAQVHAYVGASFRIY